MLELGCGGPRSFTVHRSAPAVRVVLERENRRRSWDGRRSGRHRTPRPCHPPHSSGAGDGLTRNVGFFGLLLTSEGSIIGSGWLFGALVCATIGGPAAIIAWLIGSVAVILLALVHAELGGMFPVSGGTTRFPYYAFGGLAGASFGWFSWLQAVGTAPIEVEAAITYTSNYWHGLTHTVNGTVVLTGPGYAVAVVLMALFVVVNLFGVRYLVRANNAITTWKVIIPTLTIVVLFFTHFDTSNFTRAGGFAPYGLHGVLRAVSDGGAVFALVGFEQAVQLGGESRNPQRDMPRAVIFSMLIGATIYILLQVVFIGALPHHALAHGWANICLRPASSARSPDWPRAWAWAGWPTSSTPTPSSPPPGPASSTPPPPAGSPSA